MFIRGYITKNTSKGFCFGENFKKETDKLILQGQAGTQSCNQFTPFGGEETFPNNILLW